MRRTAPARILGACMAAGLVGLASPISAAQAKPAFGGYSTEATATPLKIEVFEPVIPIPSTPQLELEVAYTKVESESGPTGTGVASWLWPGDPVGQGCKTFVEQLGLGDTGLCKDGYPVQVNSRTPGSPDKETDEPFPGALMRTSSGPKQVSSTVGYSTNGDVSDKDGGPPPPGVPGVPGLPGLPGLQDLGKDPAAGLSALGDAITGKDRLAAAEPAAPAPGLPPELAALVDVDGMVSQSSTDTSGDVVKSIATSRLGKVSFLSGLVTADSIVVTTTTTANGRSKPKVTGSSRIGGLEVAGTPVRFGKDGIEVAGQKRPLPGLPDDPAKALAALGITLEVPGGVKRVADGVGEATMEGLRVTIDTKPLRARLDAIPFADLVGAIPDEAGELKSLIGAATQLAPKFVITAGNAASEAGTVPKMDLDLPTVDPSDLTGAGAPPVSGGSDGSLTGATGDASGLAGEELAGADASAGGEGALDAAPMSAGLPPLASIPGALLVGGLLLATGVGWWLQKIGGLVLGGAGSCSHGLETGVPDLRRA